MLLKIIKVYFLVKFYGKNNNKYIIYLNIFNINFIKLKKYDKK